MLNYLQGCTEQTQIGMLPEIITHNNTAVKNEFEYIFDSSLNRLTKSVYAPTGSVKAHFGEFVNLAAEYVSIKNIDALSETIQKAIDNEKHNLFQDRFDSSASETQFKNTSFCHNASIIAYDSSYNVYQKILVDSSMIQDLSTYIHNDNMQQQTVQLNNMQSDIDDLTIDMDNIKNASLQLSYNGSTYKLSDIAQLIDWKNSLSEQQVTVTDTDNNPVVLTVLCVNH